MAARGARAAANLQASAHWLPRGSLDGIGRTILRWLCARLRDLGYVEGRDYVFEERYADGEAARLPLLADEMVRLKPDVIVVSNTAAAVAAR